MNENNPIQKLKERATQAREAERSLFMKLGEMEKEIEPAKQAYSVVLKEWGNASRTAEALELAIKLTGAQ